MSLPTSGFNEVANHFRRIACAPTTAASVSAKLPGDPTASFDAAYLASTAQRLPSTRHLDQRWDRSRGIIFANASRSSPSERDSLTRGFSSSALHSRDTSYKDMGFPARPAVKSGIATKKSANMSQEMITNYESKINRLEGEGKKLKQKIEELENLLGEKDKKIAGLDQKVKREAASVKKEFSDYKTSSNKTISDLRADLKKSEEDSKAQKAQSAAELARSRDLPEVKRALDIQDLEKNISNLEKRLEQQIGTARAELAKQQATAKTELNELRTTILGKDKEIAAQGKEIAALNEKNDGLRNACSALLQRERVLKEESKGRLARQAMRPDYGTYRGMYKDLYSATGSTLDVNGDMMQRIALEEDLWRKSKDDYDTSAKIQFLRQARPRILKAIGDYLETQAEHAKEVREALSELHRQVDQDLADLKASSHWHRELTKLHFFEEHVNNHDSARLATKLAIEPIRELRKDLLGQIRSLESRKSKATGLFERGRMSAAATELKKQYTMARGMVSVHEAVRKLKALQALQRDDPWEKAVFVATLELSDGLQRVKSGLYDSDGGSRYLDLAKKADEALTQYESDLRRQFVLEYNQGKLTKAQQAKNDKTIAKLVEAATSDVLEHFAQLSQTSNDTLQRQRALSAPMPSSAAVRVERNRRDVRSSRRFKPTLALRAEHRNLPYDVGKIRNMWTGIDEAWHGDDSAVDWTATAGGSPAVSLMDNVTTLIIRDLENVDSCAPHLHAPGVADVNMASDAQSDPPEDREVGLESSGSSTDPPAKVVSAGKAPEGGNGDDSGPPESAVIADESQTVLPYQIPAEAYRKAATSSRSTDAAFWSHELYKGPEGETPKVFYCSNFTTSETQAKLFLNEPILGFDIEWESRAKTTHAAKRNVSLIQLAAGDKIGLFHIATFAGNTIEELMPPTLKTILESPSITKAGVNIGGDAKRLHTHLEVDMKGLFELSHLYQVVKNNASNINFKPVSMATQVEKVLLLPIKKDDVRTSAWSHKLAKEQSSYAAADAYAGFMLYHTLNNERKLMKPKPPLPAFWETGAPLVLGNGEVVHKGGKRTIGRLAAPETAAADEDQDEGEEFHDALDALDNLDINSGESAELSEPGLDLPETNVSTIDYPSLPQSTPFGMEEAREQSEEDSVIPPATAKDQPTFASALKDIQTRSRPLPCPENQAADTWIIAQRSAQAASARKPASDSMLRAYHLWHIQQCELREVARFCRSPPLALNTIATYVLEVVEKEHLPYQRSRLEAVLSESPRVVQQRYRHLLKNVE